MQTLPIHWPGLPDRIGVLSTLRAGGVSAAPYDDGNGDGGLNLGEHVGDAPEAVAGNRALLRSCLPAEPAWLTQVHGSRVVDAHQVLAQGAPVQADACVAVGEGAVCAIMTADCMPVLLTDVDGRIVAAAHAGWRGLANGVLENTIASMRDSGVDSTDKLMAWLGPAIGPMNFEVGEDVLLAFDRLGPAARQAFRPLETNGGAPLTPPKYLADLPMLARLALQAAGVSRIAGGEHCTVSDPARFYSFRRDRITGRMATLIWVK